MLGHLVDVGDVQVRAGIEHIGVDVVLLDHHRPPRELHSATSNSAGSTISPATAAAAATQAFERWMPASLEPIRPRKLRFVVVIAFSPAASTPLPPPKHAPQVGVDTIAPAAEQVEQALGQDLPVDTL